MASASERWKREPYAPRPAEGFASDEMTAALPSGGLASEEKTATLGRFSASIDAVAVSREVAAASSDDQRRLGPYVLLEELGRGGMGVVYRAFDPRLGRLVAIKRLLPEVLGDAKGAARFEREAKLSARLQHPAIAAVHGYVSEGPGAPYLVLDFVPGETLAAVVKREPLDDERAARILLDVAGAVAYAHSNGVVHRDLKPGNIMLTPEGRAVVLDFGLARTVEVGGGLSLTRSGVSMGTPAYMAPEQITDAKRAGQPADVYGLGGLLYACLTGRPPFTGATDYNVQFAVLKKPPQPIREQNPKASAALEAIALRCLEKDPAARYASAAEFAAAVAVFRAGDAVVPARRKRRGRDAAAFPAGGAAGPTRRLRRLTVAVTAVVVALSLAAAGLSLARSGVGSATGGEIVFEDVHVVGGTATKEREVIIQGAVRTDPPEPIALSVGGVPTPVVDGRFEARVSLAAEGRHSIEILAQTTGGVRELTAVEVLCDCTAPTVLLEAPLDGQVTADEKVTVRGGVSDAGEVAEIVVLLDEVEVARALPAEVSLSEGERQIEVRAWDTAGNTGNARLTIRCDRTAPQVTFRCVPPAPYVTLTAPSLSLSEPERVRIEGRVDDVSPTTVSVLVNGVEVARTLPTEVSLSKGERRIEVRATDAAGNEGSAEVTLTRPPLGPAAPAGFTSLGTNEQGRPEFRHDATGIVFVLVPTGSFTMGSPDGEGDRVSYEGPQHKVELDAFLIGKTEVTVGQWRRFLARSGYQTEAEKEGWAHAGDGEAWGKKQGASWKNPGFTQSEDDPVVCVSWNDCQVFCEKVGLRLPTEAEWEYACRAGTTTPFSFGGTITPAQVNYHGNYPYAGAAKGMYRQKTVPCGSLPANPWGIHEMHGNVSEWCADVFDTDFYGKPEASRKNPVSTAGFGRVRRGGNWNDDAKWCRSSHRYCWSPGDRNYHLGLRVSRSFP